MSKYCFSFEVFYCIVGKRLVNSAQRQHRDTTDGTNVEDGIYTPRLFLFLSSAGSGELSFQSWDGRLCLDNKLHAFLKLLSAAVQEEKIKGI